MKERKTEFKEQGVREREIERERGKKQKSTTNTRKKTQIHRQTDRQ